MESINSRKWKHSRWGFEILEDRSYVGDLYEPSRDQEWVMRLQGSSTAGFSNENWSLSKSQKISNTTSRYEFQNPKFFIKLDLLGTDWIGRHYILTRSNKPKSRLYTNASMLDENIVRFRDAMIKDFENRVEGTQHKFEEIQYPAQTMTLPLVIKTYDFAKALSKTVRDSNQGDLFNIQGPVVRMCDSKLIARGTVWKSSLLSVASAS